MTAPQHQPPPPQQQQGEPYPAYLTMASTSTPKPLYHSPASFLLGRQRRGSARQSFTSPKLPPGFASPRAPCLDGDTFSFRPSHLSRWYIAEELWVRLPSELQAALRIVQRAGAAVNTGLERAQKHVGEGQPNAAPASPEVHVLSDVDHVCELPAPMLRTDSNASSTLSSDWDSPTLLSTPSASQSPSAPASSPVTPVSPMCLSPQNALGADKPGRDFSHSTPLESHKAYYAAELSQLRTESVPRLRHAARDVDLKLGAVTFPETMDADDISEVHVWWTETKNSIKALDEDCKRRSDAMRISSTGLGWSYSNKDSGM